MRTTAIILASSVLALNSCNKHEPEAGTISLSANFVSPTRIDLTWTDDIMDEVSYSVFRSTDGTSFTEIAVLGKNTYGYSDTTVAAGTIYYYYVVANKRARSDVNSNTVTAGGGFSKGYGSFAGNGQERFFELRATPDAGALVGGFTSSNAGSQNDLLAMKLTAAGDVSFQRTYGGPGTDEQGGALFPTADGGYVIAGVRGGVDHWIAKVAADGTISWQNVYQTGLTESVARIIQTSDGGYLVAGTDVGATADTARPTLIRLNPAGNITWQNRYDVGAQSAGAGVVELSDGTYAFLANLTGVNGDAIVMRVSSAGAVIWAKKYATAGVDIGRGIARTSDGGVIVAGSVGTDAWVMKLSSAGAIEWQNVYSAAGTENAYGIGETPDGGYGVAGDTNSSGAGDFDFLVMKLTSTGAVTWQKTFGGSRADNAYSLAIGSDGGLFVGGESKTFKGSNFDIWVMKLAGDGAITFSNQSGFTASNTAMAVTPGTAVSADIATVVFATVLVPVATSEVAGAAANLVENVAGSNGVSTAPSSLTAVSGAPPGKIVLNWTDNSTDENGFIIFRSTDAQNYSRVATVQMGTTTFTDTGLTTGTTYTYRIEAFTPAGYTNFSNTAAALAP